MKTIIGKSLRVLAMAFVATAFAFAGGEVYAGLERAGDCTGPGEVGSCPPFSDASCDCECFEQFGSVGTCDIKTGCCTCAL